MKHKRELIDDILDPNYNFDDFNDISSDIDTTCLSCGQTDKVPDFIYDECSRKKYHFKLKKKVPTITCMHCDKETAVPTSFIEK